MTVPDSKFHQFLEKISARKYAQVIFLILFSLAVLLYFQTFQINFFFFDDKIAIQDNPVLREPGNISAIWNTFNTRFIAGLSFALNYALNGLKPFGYHLVNVLLHILNAYLVYVLSLLTLQRVYPEQRLGLIRACAALAAVLFTIHPIQTDAVNYISQRTVLLVTFFYLGTLIFYIKSRINSQPKYYLMSFVSAFLAMFCKEIAFSLPFIVFLYEILLFKSRDRFDFKKGIMLLPFLVLLLVIPLNLLRSSDSMNPISKIARIDVEDAAATIDVTRAGGLTLSRWEYFITELNVVKTYWGLLLMPIRQNHWYDYPPVKSFWEVETAASFFLHLVLIAGAMVLASRKPVWALGILGFYLALSVESTFIPIAHVIAEYRLYLPMVFFSQFIVAILCLNDPRRFTMGVMVLAFWMGGLAFLTVTRNSIWCDEIKLWKDIVSQSPNLEKANTNLGYALISKNRYPEAVTYFEKAAQLSPTPSTFNNLGTVHVYLKNYPLAERYLSKSLEMDVNNSMTHFNLGFLFRQKGEFEQALGFYEKSVGLNPNNVSAFSELCALYVMVNRVPEGITCYQRAVERNPGNAFFSVQLVDIFKKLNDHARAFQHIELLHEKYHQPAIAEYLRRMFRNKIP